MQFVLQKASCSRSKSSCKCILYTSVLVLPLLRFDSSTDVSGFNQAKSSVVRGIRTKLLDCYPGIQDFIRDILPKKEAVQILKWYFVLCALTPLRTPSHSHEHVEILVIKNELLFFKQRDGPYVPTLRLLHKCTYVRVHQHQGCI